MRAIKKSILLFLFSSIFCGCSTVQEPPISISGKTLILRGTITNQTEKDFFKAVKENRINTVQLDSGGGDVESAIQIASEIYKQGIDVEVVGDCFSSCANYLFPAGKTKTISELGIVAWHGNVQHLFYLHETGRNPMQKEVLESIKYIFLLEKEFFNRIGVDQFLCWIGKIEPYNAANFYFMGPVDMERFGLHDVHVRSNYETTDFSAKKYSGVDMQYLSIESEIYRPATPKLMSSLK